jgi:hypothetical protein
MNQLPNHSNYNCEITASNGQKSKVYANWLHNQDQDHWQGWHCQTGTLRLNIDKNFNVFNGECKTNFLGSALTDFEPLVNGTICSRVQCTGCTDDLMTAKQQPTAI